MPGSSRQKRLSMGAKCQLGEWMRKRERGWRERECSLRMFEILHILEDSSCRPLLRFWSRAEDFCVRS